MKFADIQLHEQAITRLREMVNTQRIPHAILLSGESGVPKLPVAMAFAQYLHCQNPVNGDACGKCPSCLQHQSFNHPDTFFSFPVLKKDKIDTSDDFLEQWKEFLTTGRTETQQRWLATLRSEEKRPQIYVHESEIILHRMNLAPYSSKYKVIIMWLPENMKPECANALLKIIEEPFADSIFVLVTDNKSAVLPTIISRTQEIPLLRPSDEQLARYLSLKYDVPMENALSIALLAQGNVASAEDAIDDKSEEQDFLAKFIALMRTAYVSDLYELKKLTDSIETFKREKTKRFLAYCGHMIRENYIYNLKNPQLVHMSPDEAAFSSKFSPFVNELNVEDLVKQFSRAYTDIARNANAKIVLFDMAIQITILLNRKRK